MSDADNKIVDFLTENAVYKFLGDHGLFKNSSWSAGGVLESVGADKSLAGDIVTPIGSARARNNVLSGILLAVGVAAVVMAPPKEGGEDSISTLLRRMGKFSVGAVLLFTVVPAAYVLAKE
eukprot:TRINITY_DN503_c0_g1_i3.p2 TRINITY_DN503_c0_g1~~TRINITY_DN503_c0_g1_i3.p2  ORF type:complete len:131 (-),score=0.61 TRINITY_DN503_c0_g1_i3:91-453(-)